MEIMTEVGNAKDGMFYWLGNRHDIAHVVGAEPGHGSSQIGTIESENTSNIYIISFRYVYINTNNRMNLSRIGTPPINEHDS